MEIFRLIELMIKYMRATVIPKERDDLLNKMQVRHFTCPVNA